MAQIQNLLPADEFGKKLCAIWGLDPNLVTSLSIHILPSTVVIVEVVLKTENGDELLDVLRHYGLAELNTQEKEE